MIDPFSKIGRCLFDDEFDAALIWANLEAKQLLLDGLDDNQRWAKITKAINKRYSKIGHVGAVWLASTAMLSAQIGG